MPKYKRSYFNQKRTVVHIQKISSFSSVIKPLLKISGIVAVISFIFVNSFLQGSSVSAQTPRERRLLRIAQRRFKSVCDLPGHRFAHCHAKVITDDVATPLAGSAPSPASLGPVQFHTAYNLPCKPGGVVQSACSTPTSFGPQTIAIIDAYHTPTVENDLTVYSNQFGLPLCTKANGCLTVLNQNGGTTLPTRVNGGWALETSLDVQVAHAICQSCKILLIEANSNYFIDLAIAVNTAANLGATAISNSYGAPEWSGEGGYDVFYNHPGIAVTASSGDNGYGAEYPASSPHVVAVGGTTLQLYSDFTYASETAWSGAGSGCSSFEQAHAWQVNLSNWSLTNCLLARAVADVSAVADPNTGAAVYDTTPYTGYTGWWQVGGTSLAAPLIAAVYALSGVPANTVASSILYQNGAFHDVLSGNNGACSSIICNSAVGYDGPTGLGTPNGLIGVGGFSPIPTATPTPTILPTSTPTPSPTVIPTSTPIPTSAPTPTAIPTPTPIPDITPPSVTITNPSNNSTVLRNRNVTIRANASDNVGVAKVEFYVGLTLLTTDIAAPYRAVWRVPSGRRIKYSLTARAYDAAGNTSSNSIIVTSR